MTIDSIQNGYVLDHIPAGMGMRIYKLLGLDKTDAQVALIQNAKSSKMGKKDVLKIATDKFDLNLDAVAYLAHPYHRECDLRWKSGGKAGAASAGKAGEYGTLPQSGVYQ